MSGNRIDDYLDDLLERLDGAPGVRRRLVSEAEAHLRDAAAAFEAEGMDPDSAQSAAIAAFGGAAVIARASNRRRPAALLAASVRAAAQLGGLGCAAIGVAALAARALALATTTQWVYGAPGGFVFTAAQCAHWLAVQPGASTCHVAAAMESSDDSFLLTLAAAVLGLVVAGVVLGVMRFAHARSVARLPSSVLAAIGATAFVGAGVALVAAGVAQGTARIAWGQGALYTDGGVALLFGAVLLVRFLRTVRPVSAPTAPPAGAA